MAAILMLTVIDAMAACGVDHVTLFMDETQAQRLAADIFGDQFSSCLDITFKELDEHFKTYSDLTVAQGQIRLRPGTRKNIKAFVQWTRDELCLGRDPAMIPFPIEMVSDLIRRYKTHEKFLTDSKTLSEAAKPDKFKESTKWEDWKPTFMNYLRSIPGRDGVPLKYICRDKDEVDALATHDDFLDDYVASAPLRGNAYAIDTVQVHTFLLNFVTGNDTAEAKIQGLRRPNDGREAFQRLTEHYEGVGIHAIDIREADEVLKTLFYGGEKPPHMWWSEFEKKLTRAFNAYVKREGRIVHSDSMKIRMLIDKIKADFLTPTKAQLEIELSRLPMTITYDQSLALFRNMVNQKHPPQVGAVNHRTRRQVNEVTSGRGGSSRGRGGSGRGGRGGRHGGRGNRGNARQTRFDSRMITLTDGTQIEYHASFNFPRHVYLKMKQEDRDTLKRERTAYNQSHGGRGARSEIQELRTQIQELQQQASVSSVAPADTVTVRSHVSQLSSGTNIMGGRNEQANNRDARRAAAVITQRHVRTTQSKGRVDPPANTTAENECDTNADTCCLGRNFVVLQSTFRTADVYAYDTSIRPIENVPIVTGATAYDDVTSGRTYILVFNEALYYGEKLDHTLINPNQVRSYGIPFWDSPFDPTRSLSIDVNDDLQIPMRTVGTKLLFTTRVPTADELATCEHIHMTSALPWNPAEVLMLQATTQGGSTHPWKHQIATVDSTYKRYEYVDSGSDDALMDAIDPSLVRLGERLHANHQRSIAQVDTVYDHIDIPGRRTFVSDERHSKINAEALAEKFGISIPRAQRTLRVTTQRGVRSAILPISRRYRADRMFSVKRLNGKFATDTAYGKVKSLRGNVGSQVFSHKCGFKVCYPLQKVNGNSVGDSLTQFISDYGAPERLTFDGASVQTGPKTRFMDAIRRYEIKYHVSGPRRPNENPAEQGIHDLKKRWYRLMLKKKVPPRLWDYGFTWVCETDNVCANMSRHADGRTPLEVITGETPDISEYMDFDFYDWVLYRSNAGLGEVEVARWLGVSHRVGRLMSYWLLPISGIPISATTVQRMTNDEKTTEEMQRRMAQYEEHLQSTFDAQSADLTRTLRDVHSSYIIDPENEDPGFYDDFTRVIDDAQLKHADELYAKEIDVLSDPYVGMEMAMTRGAEGELLHATVRKRVRDEDGRPVGVSHSNPLLDSRKYEVEYIDGHVEELTANLIAENLISQVDEEGRRQMMLTAIIDHRKLKDAIPQSQGTYVNSYGVKRRKTTTRGWELLVEWRDGSSDWVSLKDLKDSYPVELAIYAKERKIGDEPAFAWWVPYVLRKQKRILQKVKTKYWARTHKYGIRIPKNIKEALEIDKEMGNTLWMDAIKLEMQNVRVAFEEFDGDPNTLVGYTQITGHLVFDVKLGENFRRKARYRADGHKMGAPASVTYSTVVSRDSVRILLTVSALNDLDILGADVQNAFLTAPNKEKCWMIAGSEFGPEEGKTFLVVKALYGLKSASFSFRSYMAEKLTLMGFQSSLADPDVWLRAATKGDGEAYYEYVLMYVDDMLSISCDPRAILEVIQGTFKFKNGKIEAPEFYLGAKLQKKSINGFQCWTITSQDYVKAAVKNVEEALKRSGRRLPTSNIDTPMNITFSPELDITEELNEDDITYFQELIGVQRWATEIGRVDILLEVSLLSQYQASPREGHLVQVLHIFAFLKKHPKLTLYMSPESPRIDYGDFRTNKDDFSEIYRDAEEPLPHRMPVPRGRSVSMTAFVDASHAANTKTRRSHTGYIVFLNRAPIVWYSKRQNTVETSTFSSEFIALKVCLEAIEHLRFKLRCFGVPLPPGEPTHVFCDNESVVKNTTNVESTLNKKHSSIAYHHCRWSVAAGVITLAHINTHDNIADCFTKRLPITTGNHLFGSWAY
jgi:Reverse transcriptase (RNA-dependent DNA polymerase)